MRKQRGFYANSRRLALYSPLELALADIIPGGPGGRISEQGSLFHHAQK